MRYRTWIVIALVGCEGGKSPKTDAGAGDAPPPLTQTSQHVIDKMQLPTTNTEARELGLDLNNDRVVDNQLGAVFGVFHSQGASFQPGLSRAVDRGTVLALVTLRTDMGTTVGNAQLHVGGAPQPAPCIDVNDTTCRRHLAGNATFATLSMDAPLDGTITSGVLATTAGTLHVPFAIGEADPTVLELVGARMRLVIGSGSSLPTGVLAGALAESTIDTKLVPGIRDHAQKSIVRHCTALQSPPECGCTSGSPGQSMKDLFDTSPQDCMVTISEIQNNSLLDSLLAPDVQIDGQAALSLGFAITAVGATYP